MIDIAIIKRRILDLAFQGKLVEQRENEGTGTDFYLNIRKQKECLVNEGKIKKEKPLPVISQDEKPFEIPKTWVWVRLRDICTKIVDGDHNPPAGIKDKTEYLMISAQNIINDKLDNMDSVRYLSEDVFVEENKRTMLEIDDILLTIVGTLGRSCVYKGGYNLSFQRSVSVITTLANSDYLKYVFDSGYIQRYMEQNATGAAQLGFYLNKVEKLVIPLPPYEEQKRISKKIMSLYEQITIIDNLQQQYSSNLEVLKSKIIDAGIQGKLTVQLPEDGTAEELLEQIAEERKQLIKDKKMKKERDLPVIDNEDIDIDIPHNWEWVRLGDISQIFGGKRIPAGRSLTTEDTGHKYIRVSEMKNGTIITDNLMYVPEDIYSSISRYIINKEDVYITVAGTIGRVGIIPDEIDGANLTENADRLVFKYLNKDWLVACLSSSYVQKQIAMVTTQVAQPKLAIKRIEELIIPLPPLAEQERIADGINITLKRI